MKKNRGVLKKKKVVRLGEKWVKEGRKEGEGRGRKEKEEEKKKS